MIQLQILNHILNTKDFSIINLNNIDKSYFFNYQNEFLFIKEHFDKFGNVPDKISFLDKFPDFDIIEVNESEDYLIKELFKDIKTRNITNAFNNIRDCVLNGDIEKAEQILNTTINKNQTYNPIQSMDLKDDTSRYSKYLDKCDNFSKYYVKTGFPELDNNIFGWDLKDDLVTIVARPGIGKSWFLFKVAVAAAEQGLTVGIYEGESSRDKVSFRLDTLISHISNGQIIHGNSNIQTDYKYYLDNLKNKLKGTIKILTPETLGDFATVSNLKAFIEKDNLDMLCVDQHSLLKDERGGKTAPDKATNICMDLKNLQTVKQIPIITVSQQNRASTEKGVGSENVYNSDRISQDSTILIFLERLESNLLAVNLVKARDNSSGKILKYNVDYDKGLYTYIPEEDELVNNEEELLNLKESYEIPLEDNNPF